MESTFNDIPEELLLKIFLLQPMNSLVLLRNVCKLWDEIISSEHFNKLLIARERSSSNSNKYLLLEGARASKSTSLVDSENYMYHGIPIKNYQCYGICDGLLCLASNKDCSKAHSGIILWNPIFRKILPPLKTEYSKLTSLCFGYHDDDYKVVKVVIYPRTICVCIYSLNTDSWKVKKFHGIVSSKYNYDYMLRSWSWHCSKGRLLNGTAYFVGDYEITSFDLSSEMFREPVYFHCPGLVIMEEYRESLVLVGCAIWETQDNWGTDLVVAMSVLRESDNSWDEILLVKGNKDYKYQPVGFINKDELLIKSTPRNAMHKYSFFLYSVENACVRQFTSREACATMVQYSSSNVKSFIGVGVKDKVMRYIKPIHAPTRQLPQQPKTNKVASSSNSYAALADSGDDLLDENI